MDVPVLSPAVIARLAAGDPDTRAFLSEIAGWPEGPLGTYDGPVLWLAGVNSDYVRPEDAPVMRALFPRVRLVRVKHAGHWVHSEAPEVFTEAVRRFLVQVERPVS